MIRVEKLSYGFPAKDLYKDVSFTIETGQHCAFIGSNGSGKSTLVDMMTDPDKYLYDGKIIKDESCRIGYASQFVVRDKSQACTVFEYLSEIFVKNQEATLQVCEEMGVAEDIEPLYEKYQALLDAFEAMDGDNYESNIRKQLYVAGMRDLEETKLSDLSGGEYKLLQIMKVMLVSHNLLILDEPDVFLDFGNLNRLCRLINDYKGTLIVITHNRYLLNHCFNKILHLENGDIQEYEGNYSEYRCAQLKEKLKLKLQSIEEQEEIERVENRVEILRARATALTNPVIGRAVNAKQSQLNRLLERRIKAPFIQVREPRIELQPVEIDADKTVLSIQDYGISFDEDLLENINFDLQAGEKVAIVGANGTGKTTLVRDIIRNQHPAIQIDETTTYACLSQIQSENMDESQTVYELMENKGFETRSKIRRYLSDYCLEGRPWTRKSVNYLAGRRTCFKLPSLQIPTLSFLFWTNRQVT